MQNVKLIPVKNLEALLAQAKHVGVIVYTLFNDKKAKSLEAKVQKCGRFSAFICVKVHAAVNR